MRKTRRLLCLTGASAFLVACGGNDGRQGSEDIDAMDGLHALAATREIPRGDAVCLGGGLALDSGLDTNRNDILDVDEVTSTTLLACKATPRVRAIRTPSGSVVRLSPTPATDS